MKVKNLLSGKEYDATVTTDHAASSYGQAVVDGEAVDPIGIEIVSATDDELQALPPHWQP